MATYRKKPVTAPVLFYDGKNQTELINFIGRDRIRWGGLAPRYVGAIYSIRGWVKLEVGNTYAIIKHSVIKIEVLNMMDFERDWEPDNI